MEAALCARLSGHPSASTEREWTPPCASPRFPTVLFPLGDVPPLFPQVNLFSFCVQTSFLLAGSQQPTQASCSIFCVQFMPSVIPHFTPD